MAFDLPLNKAFQIASNLVGEAEAEDTLLGQLHRSEISAQANLRRQVDNNGAESTWLDSEIPAAMWESVCFPLNWEGSEAKVIYRDGTIYLEGIFIDRAAFDKLCLGMGEPEERAIEPQLKEVDQFLPALDANLARDAQIGGAVNPDKDLPRSRRPNVAIRDLCDFLNSVTDGVITEPEAKRRARCCFAANEIPESLWRESWGALPPTKKRARGETERTIRKRSASDG